RCAGQCRPGSTCAAASGDTGPVRTPSSQSPCQTLELTAAHGAAVRGVRAMGGDLRATPRTPDHLRGGAAGRAHRGRLARGRGLVPDEDTVALLAAPGALGLLDDGQLGGLALLGQALVVGQLLAADLAVAIPPFRHCDHGYSPPSIPAYSTGSSASDS